jgi:hypothetical protein
MDGSPTRPSAQRRRWYLQRGRWRSPVARRPPLPPSEQPPRPVPEAGPTDDDATAAHRPTTRRRGSSSAQNEPQTSHARVASAARTVLAAPTGALTPVAHPSQASRTRPPTPPTAHDDRMRRVLALRRQEALVTLIRALDPEDEAQETLADALAQAYDELDAIGARSRGSARSANVGGRALVPARDCLRVTSDNDGPTRGARHVPALTPTVLPPLTPSSPTLLLEEVRVRAHATPAWRQHTDCANGATVADAPVPAI